MTALSADASIVRTRLRTPRVVAGLLDTRRIYGIEQL
jgi:hypothetical protein